MPQSAQLVYEEIDQSQQAGVVPQNISAILFDAERGPINDPSEIITSAIQFDRLFGGIKADGSNKGPYYAAIRALNRGTALRVCNVKHYTDINDATSLSAEFAEVNPTALYTMSGNLSAGQGLRLTLGTSPGSQLIVDFPYAISTNNTIDQALNWLNTNYQVYWYLNGPVIYTKRINFEAFVIITGDPNANLVVSTYGTGTPPTIVETEFDSVVNAGGEPLFSILPKYPGVRYNDLMVEVKKTGSYSNSFDIKVTLLNSNVPPELYNDIVIPNNYDKNYLNEIAEKSTLVVPFYFDRSNSNYISTVNLEAVFRFYGGTDGGAITAVDLIGSQVSNTGFASFDGLDDISRVASLIELSSFSSMVFVHQAGGNYATQRGDLTYYIAISDAAANVTNLITKRNQIGLSDSFSRIYSAGKGLEVLDTLANSPDTASIFITPLGDILGAAASSAEKYGPWYSFANSNRGTIFNAKSVGNKWGATGGQASLDILARAQINVILAQDNIKMVWGNFTTQVLSGQTTSLLSYNSIRDLLIFVKKSLRPLLRPFLEEPNDTATWKLIYNTIHPFFTSLETKRAIYDRASGGWNWMGDQDATSLKNLVVNTVADVQAGRYAVILQLRPINSLQIFKLSVNLSSADLSIAIAEL